MQHNGFGNSLISTEEGSNLQTVTAQKAVFRYNPNAPGFCSTVEKKLSNLLQMPYCTLLTNGTDALKAAIIATQPAIGDIVLIPAISFIATANACLALGLIPITVDVDDTGHLDPDALQSALQKYAKAKVVIAVHLDGGSSNITEITRICRSNGLYLIEDVARAFGVSHNNKYLGTFGDFGCYSFQQNKLLSSGEGGALVTSNEELFIKALAYTDHGALRDNTGYPNWHSSPGFGVNNKSNEIAGALLSAQLNKISTIQDRLKEHYSFIISILPADTYYLRKHTDIPTHVWIICKKLQKQLEEFGVSLQPWQSLCLSEHPILQHQRSLYSDNFPWNLHTDLEYPICHSASIICTLRKSLPIPIVKEDFEKLRGVLSKIVKQCEKAEV